MSPKLHIYDPVKIRDGVYYSKLIMDDGDITIQVKKNNLTIDPLTGKAILDIDSKTSEYIETISKKVIKETSSRSEEWFGKKISMDDCNTIYKNAVVEGERLHCFYDENSRFYEKKDSELDHGDLNKTNSGIALIKCVVIIFTKNSFFIRWEILQFKIKPDKITEYSIRDLEEHDISYELDNLDDKIKDITLF